MCVGVAANVPNCSYVYEYRFAIIYKYLIFPPRRVSGWRMSCHSEQTVVDINSDVIEWLTHARDIWLTEIKCNLQIKTSKVWSDWKNSQSASNRSYETVFVLKCCMSRDRSLSENGGGVGEGVAEGPVLQTSHEGVIIETQPLRVSYITQTYLTCHQHIVSVMFQLLICSLSPLPHVNILIIQLH